MIGCNCGVGELTKRQNFTASTHDLDRYAHPQISVHAADHTLTPSITGLSTLSSDPTRFQTEPPACYPASWQLPGGCQSNGVFG